jgi:hypothetical protein
VSPSALRSNNGVNGRDGTIGDGKEFSGSKEATLWWWLVVVCSRRAPPPLRCGVTIISWWVEEEDKASSSAGESLDLDDSIF